MKKHSVISHLAILFKLKDLNVKKIDFEFSGGGDDGAIDEITYYDHADIGMFRGFITNEEESILEDHVHELLTKISDWWNNDGGYGVLTLTVNDGSYIINNNLEQKTYDTENWEGNFCNKLKHKEIF